jgi:hypothetical protein
VPKLRKPRLTHVIVEREFEISVRGRKRRKVHLRFGKPRPDPAGPDHACVYQIEGLHEEAVTRRIYGVDSIQALELAMKTALVELVCTRAYEDGQLTWLGMRDLGLPVVEAIRDRIKTDSRTGRKKGRAPGRRGAGPRRQRKRS